MNTLEITSVSSRGQVVIPNNIRSELHLETGDKLAVISDGKNILLKKVEPPKQEDFKSLIKESRKYTKEAGVKKSDVAKAIKEVRSGK